MRRRLRGLALGLGAGFAAVFLAGMVFTRNMALEGTYTYLKLFNEALTLIRSSYVDEVSTDALMKGAYTGLLAELDPFSEYLTSEEYAQYQAARAAMMAMTGDNGRKLGLQPKLLIVGPSNEGAARKLLTADNNAAGATNIYKGTASLVVSPYLA